MAKKVKEVSVVKKEKPTLPADVLGRIKIIHSKYYKEDSINDVISLYNEEFDEIKEKYKAKNWDDRIIHKRALASFGNKKKKERIGGAVDTYYGIILGVSQVRDLAQKAIGKILSLWKDDPSKAMSEGFVMTNVVVNPTTGEEEKVAIIDKEGNVVPRDNREFFTRKTGGKFKNPNFDHPYAHSYRKTAIAVVSNKQGLKGIAIIELRDKAVELEVPLNFLVKFSARTTGSTTSEFKINQTITEETLDNVLDGLEIDLVEGIIDDDYLTMMKGYYEELKGKGKDVSVFKLSSSRGTVFSPCDNKIEIEKSGFPLINDHEVDINLLYKEYLYPYTAECAMLVEYHNLHQFLDEDQEDKNYDEFIVLQDVDVLQINMEESLSGNYKVYISDESLEINEVLHNEDLVDSIMVLVPSEQHIDFGQDSKINIIGSIFQFQSQDENRDPIFNEEETEDGETIQTPVYDYPRIKAYGVYAIPQYKVDVETIDLIHDDEIEDEELSEEIDVDELFEEPKKEEPKPAPKKQPAKKQPVKKAPKKVVEKAITDEDLAEMEKEIEEPADEKIEEPADIEDEEEPDIW